MTFHLHHFQFVFAARTTVRFPHGKAANTLRGAFGEWSQAFANRPAKGPLPSGLADPPWPFVFRARELDGRTFEPGEEFSFAINVFDLDRDWLPIFLDAFARVAEEGIGPGRGRAELIRTPAPGASPLGLSLDPLPETVKRVEVKFLTPTQLKPPGEPHFGVLFARVRDRICTLSSLFGSGALDIDHKGMGERASQVQTVRMETEKIRLERHSTRTGQTHPLGGFVGEAEYEGELAEFLPWLKAAEWCGVGRQTVWGNGEIRASRR